MDLSRFQDQIVPMRNKLYRLALRITGSVHTSEDVVQEVFEKVWKGGQSGSKVQNWEGWAMTLTRNLSIDKTRRKFRHTEQELKTGFDRIDSTPNPEMTCETNDAMQFIRQQMEILPEKQRTILHLRDVEEYSTEEVAEIMQISLEDVRVNLFRARKSMREKLIIFNQQITKS